jgi:uncharacterized membrane protein YdfJ with MMPL/SSD domain
MAVDAYDKAQTAKTRKKAYRPLKAVARGHLKTSGKLAAAAGGAAAVTAGIHHQRKYKGSWSSYAKSADASAFGIVHDG